MADKTGIEWTDATWNPLAGCSLVSPGCTNCYAMGHAHRLLDKPGSHYHGTTRKVNDKPVWTGKVTKAPEHIMTQPLRWTKPRMVFVNSMSDLFHETVPDEWIDEVFAIMALCPQHVFQILTKRPERMMEYCNGKIKDGVFVNVEYLYKYLPVAKDQRLSLFLENGEPNGFIDNGLPWRWPLENVWLGVSVEDQRRANERIPLLLRTPAAVRFLSMEPLVDAVDLNALVGKAIKDDTVAMTREDAEKRARTIAPNATDAAIDNAIKHLMNSSESRVQETCLYTVDQSPCILPAHDTNKIDWVIVGGESGTGARPMHPDWVRLLRDQCITAGVPFFFKQWGQWMPGVHGPAEKREYHQFKCTGDVVTRVGKKAAGRELDGEFWNQMPERAA